MRRPNVRIPIAAVLPNHVHLLVGMANEVSEEIPAGFGKVGADSLSTVVGGWKSGVRRRAGHELGVEGEIWQRRFHDRVVRDLDEWEVIADYILWNPVNWHLDPLSGSREPTEAEVNDWKRRLGI